MKELQDSRGRFRKGAHWRPRKPYWDREWLNEEYTLKQRSAAEIAREFGITENALLFWLHKHQIPRRTLVEACRVRPQHDVSGEKNPMWGRIGPKNPNWAGGRTPMRQALYSDPRWKGFARRIKWRDRVCRLCGGAERLEIHHIEPFRFAPLLFMDEHNVILLCQICHRGLKNRERYYRRRLFKLIGAI